MQTIAAFKAKIHFSALLKQVEHGEEIVITKHGWPVAKLVPAVVDTGKKEKQEAIKALLEFSKVHSLGGLSWKKLRDKERR